MSYSNSLLLLFAFATVGFSSQAFSQNQPSNLVASQSLNPRQYLENKIKELKSIVETQKPELHLEKEIEVGTTRTLWLNKMYELKILEASYVSRHYSDKLIMARILEETIGKEESYKYYPKTLGLKAFLDENGLLDKNKNLIKNREKIIAAVEKSFPKGFIVKPAAGMNSQGKSKGFYFKPEKFYADLLDEKTELYSREDYFKPFSSELLGQPTSGEMLILQENVITAAGYPASGPKVYKEVRLHTFGNDVVKGATYPRWAEMRVDRAQMDKTEEFLNEMLRKVPLSFFKAHAWGVDVFVFENGAMKIIDINTNRGEAGQWSGFMSRPQTLGAYARHVEQKEHIRFAGLNGFILRHNMGNFFKNLKKVYIEGIN